MRIDPDGPGVATFNGISIRVWSKRQDPSASSRHQTRERHRQPRPGAPRVPDPEGRVVHDRMAEIVSSDNLADIVGLTVAGEASAEALPCLHAAATSATTPTIRKNLRTGVIQAHEMD